MITSTPSSRIPYTTPTTVLNHTAHVNASGYIVDDDPDDLGMYLFARQCVWFIYFNIMVKSAVGLFTDCPDSIRYSFYFYLFTV